MNWPLPSRLPPRGGRADSFVRRAGSRRGVRRPHADYELTPKGRAVFPRGYQAVMRALVDVLPDHLPAAALRTLFDQAGERLLRQRLGEVAKRAGTTVVHACSCPLASVTADHPELCRVVAGVLSQAAAGTVRETCVRDGSPQCRFELLE